MIFRKCPYCGASLDPGEQCDCDGIPEMELQAAQVSKRKPARHHNAPDQALDTYVRTTYRRWLEQ